ncbi:MAG: glycosyltransferase family 39 protein [Myxococcales bacterium]|jgi:hypothetical protein|nr:glycosyltransferase family 39 protein [Myxococcales bacterium]
MRRFDWFVILGAATVALALELRLARVWHFGFDETWHVFIAAIDPWTQFLREVSGEPHPPLPYLLLRWLTPLHGSELWPRLLSMLPSLATIVLAALTAHELRLARPVVLLAAWLFAMSSTHLNLAVAVRGYSLATMATAAAYLFLLRMLHHPAAGDRRDRLGFVGAAVLAVWSEYASVLVVLAGLVLLGLEGFRSSVFREALRRGNGMRARWLEPLVLFCGTLAALLWMWSRPGPRLVGHLVDCFPAAGESFPGFAARGFTSTLDLFAPLGLSSGRAPLLLPAALVAAGAWLVARAVKAPADATRRLRASPVVILALVWGGVVFLAWRGIYPHGGRMRHQFLLFPFLALLLLVLLDAVHCRLRTSGARVLLWSAVAAGTIGTSAAGLRAVPIEEFSPTPTLWTAEIGRVLAERQPADVLYAARIDMLALFSHLRGRRWTAAGVVGESDELFTVADDGRLPLRILRDAGWWLPSPFDAAAAARLADTLRRREVSSAWVVALVFESLPMSSARRADGPLRTLLAAHGLDLRRRFVFPSGEAFRVIRMDPPATAEPPPRADCRRPSASGEDEYDIHAQCACERSGLDIFDRTLRARARVVDERGRRPHLALDRFDCTRGRLARVDVRDVGARVGKAHSQRARDGNRRPNTFARNRARGPVDR